MGWGVLYKKKILSDFQQIMPYKPVFPKYLFLEDFWIMTNLKSVQKCILFKNLNCAACVNSRKMLCTPLESS